MSRILVRSVVSTRDVNCLFFSCCNRHILEMVRFLRRARFDACKHVIRGGGLDLDKIPVSDVGEEQVEAVEYGVRAHGAAEAEWLGLAVDADDEHVLSLGRIVGHGIDASHQHLVELVQGIDVAGMEAEETDGPVAVIVDGFVPVIAVDAKGSKGFTKREKVGFCRLFGRGIAEFQRLEVRDRFKSIE